MTISAKQFDLSSHLEAAGVDNRQLRISAGALGDGLSGGGANPISVKLTTASGLEFSGGGLRIKLENASISRSASGIKVDTTQPFTFSGGLKRSGAISAPDDVTDKAFVDAAVSGITSDHNSLSNLGWTSSGHTGTNNSLPSFGASGTPTIVSPPASGSRVGTYLGWSTNTVLAWIALSIAVAISYESSIESISLLVSPITTEQGVVA